MSYPTNVLFIYLHFLLTYFQKGVKVHKPMEFHPELAAASSGSVGGQIMTKEQRMLMELGLKEHEGVAIRHFQLSTLFSSPE